MKHVTGKLKANANKRKTSGGQKFYGSGFCYKVFLDVFGCFWYLFIVSHKAFDFEKACEPLWLPVKFRKTYQK